METNLSKQPGKSKPKSATAAADNPELKKTGRVRSASAMSAESMPSSLQGTSGGADMSADAAGGSGKSKKGVLNKASKVAHRAADSVMHAASEQAQGLTRQVTGMLDDQVSHGADIIREVARTTRRAADDLDSTSPHVADLVRSAADRIESYAGALGDQTVEEMFETASDFTRRQPALVFGLAALAGFMAFRTFKVAPSTGQSSAYRSSDYRGQDYRSRYSGFEGNA